MCYLTGGSWPRAHNGYQTIIVGPWRIVLFFIKSEIFGYNNNSIFRISKETYTIIYTNNIFIFVLKKYEINL
jgi:hypothetical protein